MRLIKILCGLLIISGCGSTVPKPSTAPPEMPVSPDMSGPVYAAVLPFENRTSDPNLNWLRATISATLSVRLKQHGWTTADGSLVHQTMEDQAVEPSGVLTPNTAIGLSGGLYAETLITGFFAGKEKELTVTATHISGETGRVIRSVTRTVQNNDRSRLINELIIDLTAIEQPEEQPVMSVPTPFPPPALRPRDRLKVDRNVQMPEMFKLETPEQIDQAILVYRQALEQNPEYADAHFALGYAYDRQGDADRALAAYRQAVSLSPLNADYLYALGYAYERKKELRPSIEAYEKAFAIKPDDVDIAFALGYVHEKMGQYAEAIAAYSRAIELKSDDYDVYYGLAAAYEASGRLREAFDFYQRLSAMKPEDRNTLNTLGAIAAKMDRWDKVIEIYGKLVKDMPEDADVHRLLALAYKNTGQTQQAISEYKNIIRLDPSSSSYISLGNLYVRSRQYDQAIEQYRAGLKLNPSSDLLNYNLGNVLVAQKEYRAAIEAYIGYLRVAPNGEYAQKIREKLEDLRFRVMTEE